MCVWECEQQQQQQRERMMKKKGQGTIKKQASQGKHKNIFF